jgi:hypothetical protein
MTEVEYINNWLEREYGKDILGRPNWRVVFSDSQTEKRKGLISEYYGPIFIRETYGLQELKKYEANPQWRGRWVLEKLTFDLGNPELCLDVAGHYEPIWFFRGIGGSYQKPNMRAVKYLMNMWATVLYDANHKPLRDEDHRAAEKVEFDREVESFMGALEEEYGGDVASAIRHGEAVAPGVIYGADGSVSSMYAKKAS